MSRATLDDLVGARRHVKATLRHLALAQTTATSDLRHASVEALRHRLREDLELVRRLISAEREELATQAHPFAPAERGPWCLRCGAGADAHLEHALQAMAAAGGTR